MKIITTIFFLFYFSFHIYGDEIYLFDDFNYLNSKVINIDSSGSFFSRNNWKRENQSDTLLKAWFKWNSGDKEFSDNSKVNMTADGFELSMQPGFYTNDSLQPMIQSSFYLKYGTYAAICKFSDIDDDDKITQAFWLTSPLSFTFKTRYGRIQYRDEIDFEWNNWWRGSSYQQMSTGCNQRNYLYPSQLDLNCIIQSKENSLFLKSSRFPDNHKSVLSNKWALCIFQIDSILNQTRFGIYILDDGNGTEIWAGDKFEFGTFYTINNYSAYHPQCVFFTMGSAQNNVNHKTMFDIDCFFYSSNENMNYKEIYKRIDSLRKNKIERIYKGNIFFNEIEKPFIKDNFYFQGNDTVFSDQKHEWILQSDCKRWFGHYDIEEMKFRFHNKDGYWENWNNLSTCYINLEPKSYQDTLELSTKFSEYWSKYTDSAYKKIIIKSSKEHYSSIITDLKIFTHPIKDFSIINYSIAKTSNIEIALFDILGKLIYKKQELLKTGTYHFEFKNLTLPNGFYIFSLKADNELKSIKVFKR